jgi:hypothetical protein
MAERLDLPQLRSLCPLSWRNSGFEYDGCILIAQRRDGWVRWSSTARHSAYECTSYAYGTSLAKRCNALISAKCPIT